MTLMLMFLIGGSLFYMGRIFLEYREHDLKVGFELERLERKIASLEAAIAAEIPQIEAKKQQVAALRQTREDLMMKLETAESEMKAVQLRYRVLSLEVQKRQFRGTLARGRQLVLR